jgi:hypothetical protein
MPRTGLEQTIIGSNTMLSLMEKLFAESLENGL